MATKRIQVLAQNPVYVEQDFGAIPEILSDLYRAKGHNLILIYNSPQQVSAMASKHAFAVGIEDIPEEMRAEMRRTLRSYGFSVDADGTVHKGDCLLVSQPEGARQHFEQENHETWRRQGYASDTQAEMIQEEARRAAGHGAKRPSPFAGARTEGDFSGHYGHQPPSPPRQ
jgi:hypothetical protein